LLARHPELLPRRRGPWTAARCDTQASGRKSASHCQNARSQTTNSQRLNRRKPMKRTDVTYGQLDKVLRSLGFSCRLTQGEPPARRYEHKATGALVSVPPYPETDFMFGHHLVAARTTLDLYRIADPKVFDAQLQKAG